MRKRIPKDSPFFDLSRQQIYEKVWSVPVSTLAPEWRMSTASAIRICTLRSIPLPPRDHWRAVRRGLTPPTSPLPSDEEAAAAAALRPPRHPGAPKNLDADLRVLLKRLAAEPAII